MIIVNIKNGLGNQLFQYAFGKMLEWKYGEKVFFDLLRDDISEPLQSDLHVFQIEKILESNPLSRKAYLPFSVRQYRDKKQYLSYIYYKLRRKYHPKKLITEAYPSQYIDLVDKIDLRKDYYFLGFWQNPRYFKGYESRIRKMYQAVDETVLQTEIANEIINSLYDTVSLHFRRGDYSTSGFIEPTPIDFYYKCVDRIRKELSNPYFYIFTDEPEWVRANFKIDLPSKLITGNIGKDAYIDILLMSKCKNHIMSNSSFSWWGAWLDPNPDKIVFAPHKWYADADKDKFSSEITPNQWIRL